jgi:Raf kinase inhibitor-like YbhB/YbcL family protein
MTNRVTFTMALLLILLFHFSDAISKKRGGTAMSSIRVSSTAFREGELIPRKYTCDGNDLTPPLSWSSLPAGTKSVALICDDPDAPAGMWVHWVIFNIPATEKGLAEGVTSAGGLPAGSKQGINDFHKMDYGGPCPPGGTHRYFFKVYALDTVLALSEGASKGQLLKAMEGHILDQGQLMGKYSRQR